jgi:hypothetical protein
MAKDRPEPELDRELADLPPDLRLPVVSIVANFVKRKLATTKNVSVSMQ